MGKFDDIDLLTSPVEEIRASLKRCRPGQPFTRFAHYKALRGFFNDQVAAGQKSLSISNSMRMTRRLGLRPTEITNTVYPDVDMLDMPYGDESFDYVVAESVIEHVAGSPFKAMEEARRVCKTGGHVVIVVPFFYPVHQSYDYWRFTPQALQLLCEPFEEIVTEGAWGSLDAWKFVERGFYKTPVPLNPEHPMYQLALRSEHKFPIVAWIIARK